MKTLIQTLTLAALAAMASGSLALAAPAPSAEPGAIEMNGLRLNGVSLNTFRFNGVALNARNFNGSRFNTFRFNGVSLNTFRFNGAAAMGAAVRPPIRGCDAAKVDPCQSGVVAVTLASGQRLIVD
jgi:hypothetical protein